MNTKIPPLLSNYFQIPPADSLILLTGVINASTNWLIVRYLFSLLSTPDRDSQDVPNQSKKPDKVIFVSWLREWTFWKSEAKRIVGLDLDQLEKSRNIVFIDGLTELFSDLQKHERPSSSPPQATPPKPSRPTLKNPTLRELNLAIRSAIAHLVGSGTATGGEDSEPNIFLILDTPSIVLQTSVPLISSTNLLSALLDLRNDPNIRSTIISLPADGPLVSLHTRNASNPGLPVTSSLSGGLTGAEYSTMTGTSKSLSSPLETENAAFAVALTHQSDFVLSCRMLGTGFADDVSGIVRATRGGASLLDNGIDEGEWLYYIGHDGSVKVWTRGGLDAG